MRRLLPPLVFLAVLAGFLAWYFSATQVVKRRSRDLMEVLTLDVATPAGPRALAGFKLDSLLASKLEFKVPSMPELNGSHDRAEIGQNFNALCSMAKETKFQITDIESVTSSGDRATLTATVKSHVELKSLPTSDETAQAVLHWVKTDEGWRLEGADWIPAKK